MDHKNIDLQKVADDCISCLTENDFKTIVGAVDGYVDWEFMAMLLAKHYYHRALELHNDKWLEASIKNREKADKIVAYLKIFRELNREP